jgi:hypothetical protein
MKNLDWGRPHGPQDWDFVYRALTNIRDASFRTDTSDEEIAALDDRAADLEGSAGDLQDSVDALDLSVDALDLRLDALEAATTTGTFTPGFAFGGAAVGIVYVTQVGRYVKTAIGGGLFKVEFIAWVAISNNGSSAGDWTMTGLPFTASTTSALDAPCALYVNDLTAPVGTPQARVRNNSTIIDLYDFDGTTGNTDPMVDTQSDIASVVVVSGFYFV